MCAKTNTHQHFLPMCTHKHTGCPWQPRTERLQGSLRKTRSAGSCGEPWTLGCEGSTSTTKHHLSISNTGVNLFLYIGPTWFSWRPRPPGQQWRRCEFCSFAPSGVFSDCPVGVSPLQGLRGSVGSTGSKGEKGESAFVGDRGPTGRDGQPGEQVCTY